MGFSHAPDTMKRDTYDTDGDQLVDVAEGLRETGGPTTLTAGAVADGAAVTRSGTTYAGVARAGIDTNATGFGDGTAGHRPVYRAAAWTEDNTIFVSTITELTAAIGAASAGDTIQMAAGTYTLTNAIGALTIPSGVTLKGACIDQTIITQDGTLADDIIKNEGSSVGSYGIAAAALWATQGFTDTAADAGNISDGDLLFINDPASGERLATIADGDGVAGTGEFNFRHPLQVAFGATSTVDVYSTYYEDIEISDLTVACEAVATDSGINFLSVKGLVLEDVKITGPNSSNAEPALQVIVGVDVAWRNVILEDLDYRWLLSIASSVDLDVRGYQGSGSSGASLSFLNRVNYSTVVVQSNGGTADEDVRVDQSHRNDITVVSSANVADALELNSSDDNVYHVTARGGVDDNGAGNVGDVT